MDRLRRKEIIEFLKTNRVQYKLWTEEEKEVAGTIKRKHWKIQQKVGQFEAIPAVIELNLLDVHIGDEVYQLDESYSDDEVEYCVHDLEKYRKLWYVKGSNARLDTAMITVGFAGIKFMDCKCGRLKRNGLDEFMMGFPNVCPKCGPYRPVQIRFVKEVAE